MDLRITKFVKNCIIYSIKLYCKILSPLKMQSCRFYPSCSSYAIEAIHKYGVIRGITKSVARVFRCNPFSNGGYDPV